MGNFAFIDIVILGVIAAFIIFRLRSVLGRRTGFERPPTDAYTREGQPKDDTVVPLPTRGPTPVRAPVQLAPAYDGPFGAVLTRIRAADRNFDRDRFLSGARAAHEMIVTAFAAGDRRTLRPLLSDDVYRAFDEVISRREQNGEKAELTIVSAKNAEIADAAFNDRTAELTARFQTEQIACVRNREGKIVEGSSETVRQVVDLWTFARDVRSSDPNWKLVATASPD